MQFYIKNMVCNRCKMVIKAELEKLHLHPTEISLGEVTIEEKKLSKELLQQLSHSLKSVGFELIDTRINKLIEDIKQTIMEYLAMGMDSQAIKLSSFITKKIPYDYSYLSDLFSSVEGKTIEQFFLLQRIEKVKELLVYDQLSLTEISYQTGFSSVHHLSSQFKKLTGLTPSHFKKIE